MFDFSKFIFIGGVSYGKVQVECRWGTGGVQVGVQVGVKKLINQ